MTWSRYVLAMHVNYSNNKSWFWVSRIDFNKYSILFPSEFTTQRVSQTLKTNCQVLAFSQITFLCVQCGYLNRKNGPFLSSALLPYLFQKQPPFTKNCRACSPGKLVVHMVRHKSFGRRDIYIHYFHGNKIASDVRLKTLLFNALKISETLSM